MRQTPVDKPVRNIITHFYKDPFTGDDSIPKNKILSLTLNEAVAEKLKAAITRKDVAIRDYYDLWFINEWDGNAILEYLPEFHDRMLIDLEFLVSK